MKNKTLLSLLKKDFDGLKKRLVYTKDEYQIIAGHYEAKMKYPMLDFLQDQLKDAQKTYAKNAVQLLVASRRLESTKLIQSKVEECGLNIHFTPLAYTFIPYLVRKPGHTLILLAYLCHMYKKVGMNVISFQDLHGDLFAEGKLIFDDIERLFNKQAIKQKDGGHKFLIDDPKAWEGLAFVQADKDKNEKLKGSKGKQNPGGIILFEPGEA